MQPPPPPPPPPSRQQPQQHQHQHQQPQQLYYPPAPVQIQSKKPAAQNFLSSTGAPASYGQDMSKIPHQQQQQQLFYPQAPVEGSRVKEKTANFHSIAAPQAPASNHNIPPPQQQYAKTAPQYPTLQYNHHPSSSSSSSSSSSFGLPPPPPQSIAGVPQPLAPKNEAIDEDNMGSDDEDNMGSDDDDDEDQQMTHSAPPPPPPQHRQTNQIYHRQQQQRKRKRSLLRKDVNFFRIPTIPSKHEWVKSPRIHMVVATCSLGNRNIDLRRIAQVIDNAEYPAEGNRPCCVMRLRNPKVTCSVFANGTVNVMGAKTAATAKLGLRQIARKIQKLYNIIIKEQKINPPLDERDLLKPIYFKDFRVTGMNGTARTPFYRVNLESMASEYVEESMFIPDDNEENISSKGLEFTLEDPHVDAKIFHTGTITMNLKNDRASEFFRAMDKIYPIVGKFFIKELEI